MIYIKDIFPEKQIKKDFLQYRLVLMCQFGLDSAVSGLQADEMPQTLFSYLTCMYVNFWN